jgi:ketosteroid isomerase-like protein
MQAQVHHLVLLAGLTLAGIQVGCQVLQQHQPDTHADESAIRQADIDWAKAAAAKDVEKIISFYADDGTAYPPNQPMAAGKPALKVIWTGMVNLPGFMISWVPSRVEVAKSGDLGWSTGTYSMNLSVAGAPPNDHGKYVVVWKKQQDGSWKAVADIFNSDLPAAASAQSAAQQSQSLTPAPPR